MSKAKAAQVVEDDPNRPGWHPYTDSKGRQVYRFVPLPFGLFAKPPDPELKYSHVCDYCEQPFKASRPHSKTCSPACRTALHRALKEDPLPAGCRADSFSAERRAATGWGWLSRGDSYELDKRARKRAGLDQD